MYTIDSARLGERPKLKLVLCTFSDGKYDTAVIITVLFLPWFAYLGKVVSDQR